MIDNSFVDKLKLRAEKIVEVTQELKDERACLKAEIQASDEYQVLEQQTLDINRAKGQILFESTIIRGYNERIKELNEELSTLREILSAELVNYYKENDDPNLEIDGNIYEIIVKAKIKKTDQPSLFGGQRDERESDWDFEMLA